MTPTFSAWLVEYEAFKRAIKPIVSSKLPTEVSELEAENQAIPPLLSAALEHEAMAARFHEQAKAAHLLMAQFKWALRDSVGVAQNLKQRGYAVSAALRRGM